MFPWNKKITRTNPPVTRVKMLNSVDEYIAGFEYELNTQLADSFILKGYAEGEVSDNVKAYEISPPQIVSFGG